MDIMPYVIWVSCDICKKVHPEGQCKGADTAADETTADKKMIEFFGDNRVYCPYCGGLIKE